MRGGCVGSLAGAGAWDACLRRTLEKVGLAEKEAATGAATKQQGCFCARDLTSELSPTPGAALCHEAGSAATPTLKTQPLQQTGFHVTCHCLVSGSVCMHGLEGPGPSEEAGRVSFQTVGLGWAIT